MADNSKKLSQLPTASNAASTDRLLILRDPAGSPSTRTITVAAIGANLVFSNSVPANPNSSGIAGTIRYDSDFIYVCVANNSWKRSTLSAW